MKFYSVLVVIAVLSCTAVFGSIPAVNTYTGKEFTSVSDKYMYETTTAKVTVADVNNLVRFTIPANLVPSFLRFTECEKTNDTLNLRLQLLAVGWHESQWTATKSHKPNKDKSWDLGYLMLNDRNLRNRSFMNAFGIDRCEMSDPENDLEFYMIICINFYKYLYNRFGEDAPLCYNCGEMAYLRNKVPPQTRTYKRKVIKYLNDYIRSAEAIAEERASFYRSIVDTLPKWSCNNILHNNAKNTRDVNMTGRAVVMCNRIRREEWVELPQIKSSRESDMLSLLYLAINM